LWCAPSRLICAAPKVPVGVSGCGADEQARLVIEGTGPNEYFRKRGVVTLPRSAHDAVSSRGPADRVLIDVNETEAREKRQKLGNLIVRSASSQPTDPIDQAARRWHPAARYRVEHGHEATDADPGEPV
jgi:hypothetical protein